MTNNNTSAVLNVVAESTDLTSILRDSKDMERSSSLSTMDNSLVQSPSIESFSTVNDIENLSELNVDINSDLCIKIDNPQKHLDTLETFITFRIVTKVARIEFPENEYIVRRRYNDFLWLRQKLMEAHPFCIIPPLPAKHSLIGQLDRYSKDFMLVRMKALNVFITRIVQHPILSCNENFKHFITVKQPDFNMLRRQRSNPELVTKPPSISYVALKNKNIEFEKMKQYLTSLVEKVTTVEKISNRVNKERTELVSELQYFYPIFVTWATTESELSKIHQWIARALEKKMTAQNELISSYNCLIASPVKDFITYVEVVQDALHKRDAYQAAYESSLEDLNKKRIEKDKLLVSPQSTLKPSVGFSLWKQPTCDEKLEKLGSCIPQLVKKVEYNQDQLECANEQLRSDVDHWQLEKQQILKKILLDFATKHIEYYEQTVAAWENVKSKIIVPGNK